MLEAAYLGLAQQRVFPKTRSMKISSIVAIDNFPKSISVPVVGEANVPHGLHSAHVELVEIRFNTVLPIPIFRFMVLPEISRWVVLAIWTVDYPNQRVGIHLCAKDKYGKKDPISAESLINFPEFEADEDDLNFRSLLRGMIDDIYVDGDVMLTVRADSIYYDSPSTKAINAETLEGNDSQGSSGEGTRH